MAEEGTTNGAPAEPPAAASTEAPETEAPAEPWRTVKHKIKLEGQEFEVDYDELLAGHMRQKSYTKKTQALAEDRKKIQTVLEALDKRPHEVLGRLGPEAVQNTLRSLIDSTDPAIQRTVESFFREIVEESKLPEEEVKRRKLEAQLKDREKELEAIRQREQELKDAESVAQARETLSELFDQHLAEAGLVQEGQTPSDYLVARMAIHCDSLRGDGAVTDKIVSKAAALVKKEYESERQTLLEHVLKNLDADALAELLGDDKLSALRARDIERVKGAKPKEEEPAPKKKGERPLTTDEFRERRRRERYGG